MFVPIHDANPHEHIHFHYATLGLITLNVVIFIAFPGSGEDAFYAFALIDQTLFGAFERPAEIDRVPELATLVTHAFLHHDIWHLGGNMLFLWIFGDNVEDATGHWRFLLFYCLCAIGAGLLEALIPSDSVKVMVGASGAVAGVVAAYFLLHPRVKLWILLLGKIPLRMEAGWVIGGWIIYQIWAATRSLDDGVAWWAHIGGFATGGMLILFLRRPNVRLFDLDLPAAAPTGILGKMPLLGHMMARSRDEPVAGPAELADAPPGVVSIDIEQQMSGSDALIPWVARVFTYIAALIFTAVVIVQFF